MARKRYKPKENVAKLRQVDVLVSQGQNTTDAIRQIGVSDDEVGETGKPKNLRRDRSRQRRPTSDQALTSA